MQTTRKQQNAAVNQNRDTAEDEIERFLESYRAGKVKGAILTYELEEDGESKHMLMGSHAENIGAAMDQVKRLDLAVSRRFFSGS